MVTFPKYESYKDSGVEWLGEIPSHWNVKRMKFLGNIKTGEKDTVDKIEDGLYPFFVRSQTVERINTYSHDEEAVLTAGDGVGVGKVFHYINGKFDYHQRVYKVSKFREIIGKYLFYYMESFLYEEVIKLSAKSTVDSLRLPMFLNFPIIYGEIEVQQRIVEFLDRKTSEIDQAIAQKQRLIELLQEQKAILINQAVTKGLDPNVPMCDSNIEWIGEIPAHWKVKRVKHVTRQIVDGAHLTPTYVENGIPFLRVTDISARNKTIDLETVKRIPEQEHIELCKRAKAAKGDILLSKNGTIGITKLVDWDFEFSFFVSLCLIKPKEELIPDYFCLFFDSPLVDEQLNFGSKQTSVTNLHLDKIKELLIVLPPVKEQLDLVKAVEHQFEHYNKLINSALNAITLLTEYKQILITQAVTGKIKV